MIVAALVRRQMTANASLIIALDNFVHYLFLFEIVEEGTLYIVALWHILKRV